MERSAVMRTDVVVDLEDARLDAVLSVPVAARGVVLFAHGSGSGRMSPRNMLVAHALEDAGLATLLIDLLTVDEQREDARTGLLRFDIDLLGARVLGASRWLRERPVSSSLALGYFGASTGAAAALHAASELRDVFAVVSRGGRPDLARDCLKSVRAPSLLIVGGEDVPIIPLNEEACEILGAIAQLVVIPGATHLFEEPGALEEVARLSRDWFVDHLPPPARGA
ncbi:MAG TPA: dienelactone hydrolase family protein [Gemmatimonadaceae bacterium]|nr:dienelactone hydrolase family protein [Gemmatimonadaceae bacterium]